VPRVRDPERFQAQRDAILDAAAREFEAAGYEATTMDAIAARVGVTKPAIYYYFEDKEDLLLWTCQRAVDTALSVLLPEGHESADHLADLDRVVTGHLELLSENLEALTLLFTERRLLTSEKAGGLQRSLRELTHRLEAFIEAGVEAGQFRSVDPRLTALAILGMLNSAHRWLRQERRPVAEVAAVFTDLVRAALVARA
jgi:TetR/AcrR family transcriptional regulator, cholesterol catabolism regulator